MNPYFSQPASSTNSFDVNTANANVPQLQPFPASNMMFGNDVVNRGSQMNRTVYRRSQNYSDGQRRSKHYPNNNLSQRNDYSNYSFDQAYDLEDGLRAKNDERIKNSNNNNLNNNNNNNNNNNLYDIGENHILFDYISKSQYKQMVKYWEKLCNNVRLIFGLFLVFSAFFIYWYYGRYLTFTSIRENHSLLVSFIDNHPFLAPLTYIIVCVVVVGLTIPGATVLCMASGLFFKQPFASIYAWIGCDIGAILCFILVRAICKDCLKSKVSKNSKMFQELSGPIICFIHFV